MGVTAISWTPSSITLDANNQYKKTATLRIYNDFSRGKPYACVIRSSTHSRTIEVKAGGLGTDLVIFSFSADEWFTADNNTLATISIEAEAAQTTTATPLSLTLSAPPKLTSQSIASSFPDGITYIETITTLSATATFEGLFGATISSVSLYLLPSSTPIAMTLSSDIWSASTRTDRVGDLRVAFKATDSRGNVFQGGGKDITVKVWEDPVMNAECFRCDSNGDKDMAGGYLSITGWATARPADLAINTFSVSVTDSDGVVIVSGQALVSGTTVIVGNGNISSDKSYTLNFTVIDNASDYGGMPIVWLFDKTIPIVKRIINIKDGGTGIAFGKLATDDNLTDSVWDINTEGEYLVQGVPLVNTLPDASYSERGLMSTGEQYFKGHKTFTDGVMCLSNAEGTRYTEFDFRDVSFSADPTASSGARAAYIINQRPNARSSLGNALALVLRSPLSDGTGYASGGEVYKLPTATNDLSGTAQYDILTTKSPVAVEQGGTGATTLAGAQSALQIRPTYTFSVSSSTPRSLTVPSNSRHMIVVVGSAATRHGLFLVDASSSGAIGLVEVHKGSGLTTSTGTNTFSITSNGAATIMVITLSGSSVS